MTCPTPKQFKAVRSRYNLAHMGLETATFKIEYTGDIAKMIVEDNGTHDTLATFSSSTSHMVSEFMCFALKDMADALAVIDKLNARNTELKKKLNTNATNEQNAKHFYSKASAIMCARYDFRQFLHAQHGLKEWKDETAIATRLRGILRIESRKELDTDPAARKRWFKLVDDFERSKKKNA